MVTEEWLTKEYQARQCSTLAFSMFLRSSGFKNQVDYYSPTDTYYLTVYTHGRDYYTSFIVFTFILDPLLFTVSSSNLLSPNVPYERTIYPISFR